MPDELEPRKGPLMPELDSFPDWEEWSGLSDDQRQYSLYKMLRALHGRLDQMAHGCVEQKIICTERFQRMQNRKFFDTTIAAVGGAISGLLGALGIKMGGQ